jgi:hypothetical protein
MDIDLVEGVVRVGLDGTLLEGDLAPIQAAITATALRGPQVLPPHMPEAALQRAMALDLRGTQHA